MAGGWGRFLGEWLGSLVVLFAAVLWFAVMTLIVLPFTLVRRFVAPPQPKEGSSSLITGASSGIGAELARAYSKRGVKLVLTARRADKLASVKKVCEAMGATVKALSVDFNDKDDMNKHITATDDEWPLDLVIANAGVAEATFMLQGKEGLSLDTVRGDQHKLSWCCKHVSAYHDEDEGALARPTCNHVLRRLSKADSRCRMGSILLK